MSNAAGASGKPLKLFVELDIGTRRTGARTPEAALTAVRRITQSNSLEFAGIHAYAGHLQHIEDYVERQAEADRCAKPLAVFTEMLDAEGLMPPIVSGAGTGSHEIDAARGNYTEMQCGSYIFTDVQYNACPLRESAAHPFESSLFVGITVISSNGDGLAITGGNPLTGTTVDSFDDHRIAMAMGVAALVASGQTTITNAEVARVSFPGFWDTLRRLQEK